MDHAPQRRHIMVIFGCVECLGCVCGFTCHAPIPHNQQGSSELTAYIAFQYQMLTLPAEMIALLAVFAPEISKPVWGLAQVLLVGAIWSHHKRTVTGALRAMGLSQEKRFDKYHRVLSQDKWSALRLSRILLECSSMMMGVPTSLNPPC